jgi:hypothetical protein
MNPWKRLFFYLFLNAVVSAVTTLTVISIWDRTHKPTIQPVVQPVAQFAATKTREAEVLKPSAVPPTAAKEKQDATAVSSTPEKASAPAGGSMQIENVFGVGDLNTEVILLKHTGTGELWLTGWKLEDENNHRYLFPQLMLNKDGAIKLYTKPGTNTVIELHWGIKEPVWKSGELVTLLDQNGTAQATYRIP